MKTFSALIFVILFAFVQNAFGAIISPPGSLTLIGTNQFYGAKVEGFEGAIDTTSGTANATKMSGELYTNGRVLAGKNSAYTFPSGATFNSAPNLAGTNLPEFAVLYKNEGFGFGSYGSIGSSSQLPSGSHIFVEYGTTNTQSSFTFSFPGVGTTEVGAYLTGRGHNIGQDYDTMTALDISGNTIGNILVLDTGNGTVPDWNFVGVTSSNGTLIKSVIFSYYTTSGTGVASNPAIDNLMFMPTNTWSISSGTQTVSSNISLAGSLSINLENSANLILSGAIDGIGDSLTKNGTGTLVLSGTGSWTDGTYIDQGTAIVNNPFAMPSNKSLTVGGGGIFIFDPSVSAGIAQQTATQIGVVPEPTSFNLLLAFCATGLLCWIAICRKKSASP